MKYALLFICLPAAGCTGIPENVTPVDNFDIQPCLGVWYEIARLDHSFERELSRVSAEYDPRGDGGILRIWRHGTDICGALPPMQPRTGSDIG